MVSFPYHSHIFRDCYGNSMGSFTIRGSHYWGSLKIPLKEWYGVILSIQPFVFLFFLETYARQIRNLPQVGTKMKEYIILSCHHLVKNWIILGESQLPGIFEWQQCLFQSKLRQCFKVRTSQKTGMAVLSTHLFTGSKRCSCRNSSKPLSVGLVRVMWFGSKGHRQFTNWFPVFSYCYYKSLVWYVVRFDVVSFLFKWFCMVMWPIK